MRWLRKQCKKHWNEWIIDGITCLKGKLLLNPISNLAGVFWSMKALVVCIHNTFNLPIADWKIFYRIFFFSNRKLSCQQNKLCSFLASIQVSVGDLKKTNIFLWKKFYLLKIKCYLHTDILVWWLSVFHSKLTFFFFLWGKTLENFISSPRTSCLAQPPDALNKASKNPATCHR